MRFEEKPEYNYMLDLIRQIAAREGIDLFDNMFDWAVKAVTIKHFSSYYDYFDDQEYNPLEDDGKFQQRDPEIEKKIYEMAKKFSFKDPK